MKKILFLLGLFFTFESMAYAPQGYSVDPNCPKTAPFRFGYGFSDRRDLRGECISCDADESFLGELEQKDDEFLTACKHYCPERIIDGDYCRKACPKDKPFFDKSCSTGCKSCAEEPLYINKNDCLQCPNMRWVESEKLCIAKNKIALGFRIKLITKDGKKRGLLGRLSGCEDFPLMSCDQNDYIAAKITAEECAVCPNTYMKDGWCYFGDPAQHQDVTVDNVDLFQKKSQPQAPTIQKQAEQEKNLPLPVKTIRYKKKKMKYAF